jgi:putative CocE/NonD family hydrolase
VIDLQRDYLRWFDRWLKGVDNGIEREPLVNLFVMGPNRWVQGAAYPLAETTFRQLYLASGGAANTSAGDGRLTFDPPAPGVPPDRYVYDPGDPTPDFKLYAESAADRARTRRVGDRQQEAEEHHRRIAERRHDVLVYETAPLAAPLAFAGPVSAVLYASSSARDTDWFVTLSEVDSEGRIFQLVQGRMRARYRNSPQRPEMLVPEEIYCYQLDLWHTAIGVPAGAKLRVEIASAAFPAFSRNLNTGGHNELETEHVAATQTVFHDRDHPSHVLLPVIPLPP